MQQATPTGTPAKLYTQDEVDALLAAERAEMTAGFERTVTEFYAEKLAELDLSPLPG